MQQSTEQWQQRRNGQDQNRRNRFRPGFPLNQALSHLDDVAIDFPFTMPAKLVHRNVQFGKRVSPFKEQMTFFHEHPFERIQRTGPRHLLHRHEQGRNNLMFSTLGMDPSGSLQDRHR